ncbi:MAG TPA: hypothetical protein ENH45_06550 [Nitrospirae bacterium]|nr:hypothetical protein [Nitrospirota bacterium]HDO66976.1 hypothetical protein [Nitrospirota bacterium]HDZ84865.1 hypothetical protein [Nitrospirota bacterium]HEW81150.1 hypothetical protein [Nitrospirota bacterium]
MMERLQELIEKIKVLESELSIEIQKKQEEFFYNIKGRRVLFEEATRKYHKTLVTNVHTYLLNATVLNIVTAPIIWACLIPAVFMDLIITVYQAIYFPIYNIPKVDRSEHIIIDHHDLEYLNIFEKVNCVYCGYFNGMISYVQEVAARTEQYWCPIKHARKIKTIHSRYKKFFEYGDADGYKKEFGKVRRDFEDLKDE